MKYVIRIAAAILVIFLFIQLTGHIRLNYYEGVASPENKKIPIAGTWKINNYKFYNGTEQDEERLKQMVGKDAVFSENYAAVADISCENPKYSVKSVNTEKYLSISQKISDEMVIPYSISQVISVSSQEKHFFDIIEIKENEFAVLTTGGMAFLEKISDNIADIKKSEDIATVKMSEMLQPEEKNILKSGVLLGIKTTINKEGSNTVPEYKYRTIWIGSQNNTVMPVKETENLLVPRITGFWKLDMERVKENNSLYDRIYSYPLENTKKSISLNSVNLYKNIVQNITFVGNDYISMEYGLVDKNNKLNLTNLKIVPLSTPENGSLKISEIFGDKAKDTLNNSASNFLQSLNVPAAEIKKLEPSESNIAMYRKNGHWMLKGRLITGVNSINDFGIGIIPEKKLVNYDNLTISWKDVKAAVPEALDIFESPNSDFAIVVTKNNISVHKIVNNVLYSAPMAKISIGETDSIIMSEWATGDYTEKWDRTISSMGKVIN